jgi:ATP-dependent RNA helicase DeaD
MWRLNNNYLLYLSMDNFNSLNMPNDLKDSLTRMNLTIPTPIQAQTIPLALEGKDVIGSAQTGTGKTMAFLVPVLSRILQADDEQTLILTPTRELATQIQAVVENLLLKIKTISSVLLIGGAPIFKQIHNLKKRPNIIVGTPGRVTDHLNRKSLNLKRISMLVIDESDRMLDMGFSIQLDEILKFLPAKRQTLMFSATFSPEILRLSKKYLQDPERVTVGSLNKVTPKIKQDIKHTSSATRYSDLSGELDAREGSIIVFVNTKILAESLTKKLSKDNHSVSTIHGDVMHRKRERVIKNFRAKNFRIMIATDIASRGLDISHVEHVVNYDLPMSPEDYIHRIGRTGRADSDGSALNLILPNELNKWKRIERLLDPSKGSSKGKFTKSKSPGNNRFKKSKFKRFFSAKKSA